MMPKNEISRRTAWALLSLAGAGTLLGCGKAVPSSAAGLPDSVLLSWKTAWACWITPKIHSQRFGQALWRTVGAAEAARGDCSSPGCRTAGG
jgi:hypothetical protein